MRRAPSSMYYYIYDTFLAEKKYERVIAAVETRLTDLGISGKIGRLTPFTNARGLIRDESRRGVQTVVVVGNDETVAKVIEGIGEAKITLGIIPVGAPTVIARALGIPEGVDACDVLSKRITQRIDLGVINGRFFLSHVRIAGCNAVIEGEGTYKVSAPAADCELIVSNLRDEETAGFDVGDRSSGDPKDGFLDALIAPKRGGMLSSFGRRDRHDASIIPIRKISVKSEQPFSVVADGRTFTHSDVSIEIAPERLKIITGRERAFA